MTHSIIKYEINSTNESTELKNSLILVQLCVSRNVYIIAYGHICLCVGVCVWLCVRVILLNHTTYNRSLVIGG